MKAILGLIFLLSIVAVQCAPVAIVTLTPTSTGPQGASGTVTITESLGKPGIDLHVQITGLTADSVHGFHIHQYADLNDATGTGFGGHYNPYSYPHSCPSTTNRHVGDMGNITADASGNIDTVVYNELAGLDPNNPSTYIIGRGIVLHANPDDCVTANTGNAGGRHMFGVIGYAFGSTSVVATTNNLPGNVEAVAKVIATTGNTVAGNVTFSVTANGAVSVRFSITGLTPNTTHGIHLHQYGDITWNNGTAAGGHFNPFNQPHGCPPNAARHVGDMGSFTSDLQGNIYEVTTNSLATLAVNNNASIIGRAVVVHANVDDCVTANTGNAGGRLAHGVIGFKAPTVVATTTTAAAVTTTAAPTNAPTTLPNSNPTSDAFTFKSSFGLVLALVAVLFAILA